MVFFGKKISLRHQLKLIGKGTKNVNKLEKQTGNHQKIRKERKRLRFFSRSNRYAEPKNQ